MRGVSRLPLASSVVGGIVTARTFFAGHSTLVANNSSPFRRPDLAKHWPAHHLRRRRFPATTELFAKNEKQGEFWRNNPQPVAGLRRPAKTARPNNLYTNLSMSNQVT